MKQIALTLLVSSQLLLGPEPARPQSSPLPAPGAAAPPAAAGSLPETAPRSPVEASAGPGTSKNPGYRIGPRDLLAIRVFETPELSVERRVSEDGDVNLPLVGDVQVAGLSETETAQKIKGVLEAKLLQGASVAVQVMEFRARPISVIGAVRLPGSLSFSGRWTLLEALTAAGGLTESHGNLIYVLRRADTGLTDQVAIPADDLLVRADPKLNIPIFAGDLINVPGAVDVTVYCLGQVHQPWADVTRR